MNPTYAIHAACGLPFAEHDNRSPDTVSPFGCPKKENQVTQPNYEIADDEPVGTAHDRMVEEATSVTEAEEVVFQTLKKHDPLMQTINEQTLGRIRKDGGWDRRYRMPPAPARLEWEPLRAVYTIVCAHCQLMQDSHINGRFCPEWRLRQLDGDR